jgi:hypothetical protein
MSLAARWGRLFSQGHFAALAGLVLVALAAAGCSGAPEASRSLSFDAHSDKAVVIIGTSVTRAQEENIGTERSLSTFWQEYDPDAEHLVPGGKTFQTKIAASAFSAEPAYLKPTVSVLEIDPGDYALIGAGFPNLMTIYVRPRPTKLLNGGPGRRQSWYHTVDPRVHIDPEAAVVPRENFLFSVLPGQVLYIGHFQFVKSVFRDDLDSIRHSTDEASARKALAGYPGISGPMVTYDPTHPPQQVSR